MLRSWLSVTWLGCAIIVVQAAQSALGAEPKRPLNVLLVIADDLSWADIGYHGSEIKTPNLDKLAQNGVRLERHYVYSDSGPSAHLHASASRWRTSATRECRLEGRLPTLIAPVPCKTLLKQRVDFH